MADIPEVRGRIYYDGRVTLGNLLTILGGVVFAAGIVYRAGQLAASVEALRQDVIQIKCDIASHGWGATPYPCYSVVEHHGR